MGQTYSLEVSIKIKLFELVELSIENEKNGIKKIQIKATKIIMK